MKMINAGTSLSQKPFPGSALTSFTFGCMSLGNDPGEMRNHIRLARTAMETGVWFHASQEYAGGGAFMILHHAYCEARKQIPRMILKIRCDNAEVLKFDVEDALRRLTIDQVSIAQLCRAKHDRRPVVDDFLDHGEMWQVCQDMQKQGKVGQFVMEIFASFSPDAIRAVQSNLFPGYIFYFSPGERQTNTELFELLESRNENILSLRTMCGGILDPARIQTIREKKPEDRAILKFEALQPLFEQSGCASWAEFSFSFLKSFPNLLTSIAGTSKEVHFRELLACDQKAKPMAPALVKQINALHREWSLLT
ncbi:MAG: aldo/keto reductase [Victivallales bacterium]|jgi:aryl-alcohol dehydrogenase-like predicted oxidoreductase